MSWASGRKTSRIGDLAYCLLGIFGVHMPLLYGEGEHAFIRLQEEIIRISNDQSIFVWDHPVGGHTTIVEESFSLLASSPAAFRDGGRIMRREQSLLSAPSSGPSTRPSELDNITQETRAQQSYSMINRGLEIRLPLLKQNQTEHTAILTCGYEDDFGGPIGLRLRKWEQNDADYEVHVSKGSRLCVPDVTNIDIRTLYQTIYIARNFSSRETGYNDLLGPTAFAYSKCMIKIARIGTGLAQPFKLQNVLPKRYWNEKTSILWLPLPMSRLKGAFTLLFPNGHMLGVFFGCNKMDNPWITAHKFDDTDDLETIWRKLESNDMIWDRVNLGNVIFSGSTFELSIATRKAMIMGEEMVVIEVKLDEELARINGYMPILYRA